MKLDEYTKKTTCPYFLSPKSGVDLYTTSKHKSVHLYENIKTTNPNRNKTTIKSEEKLRL